MIKHKNNNRVVLVEDSDVNWDFQDGKPTIYLQGSRKSYGTHVRIDPFPCYYHNFDYVAELVEKMEKVFPIGAKPIYFILPFETEGRTNGWADPNYYYDNKNGEANPIDPYVVLIGKRICLHPAITRYLLHHEYGHHIDYWINYCRGDKHESVTEFDKEYAKMREIELNSGYGGRKWHNNIGEIIANDCRISVFNCEPEFWPHPCIHPNESLVVKNFWYEQMLKYSVN